MTHVDLHPEDLIDRERLGILSTEERRRLDEHRAHCDVCAIERRLSGALGSALEVRSDDRGLLDRMVAVAMEDAPAADDAPVVRRRRGGGRSFWRRVAAAIFLLFVGAGSAAALWSFARDLMLDETPPARPREDTGSSERTAGERDNQTAPPLPAPSVVLAPAPSPSPLAPRVPPRTRGASLPAAPTVVPEAAPSVPTAAEAFAGANRARREGRDVAAEGLYEALQRDFAGSPEAAASWVSLGRLRLDRLGDAAGALGQFDAYLIAHPEGTLAEEAQVGRAIALMRLGRRAEERAAWEALLATHAGSVHAERARERLRTLR